MKKNNNNCRTITMISKRIYKRKIAKEKEKENNKEDGERKNEEIEAARCSKATRANLKYFLKIADYMSFLFCYTGHKYFWILLDYLIFSIYSLMFSQYIV